MRDPARLSGPVRDRVDLVAGSHGVGHVVGVSALGRGTPAKRHAGLVTASLALDDLIASTGVAR